MIDEDIEKRLRVELLAEQRLLELWMMRDLRFVVLSGIRGRIQASPER